MCLNTVGETEAMKDYSEDLNYVLKYNILVLNGKECLIRPVDEKCGIVIIFSLTTYNDNYVPTVFGKNVIHERSLFTRSS